jgi:CSLREA domain-containing protein
MKNIKHWLVCLLILGINDGVFAGGIPLTTDDSNLTTAINSNGALLDVLSNDDSGINGDNFKELTAVCAVSSSDMDCTGNSFTDGIGTVTVNGSGNANNALFDSNHNQSHTFEFKYKMRNSASNPGFGFATVTLSFIEVNNTNDAVNNNCDASACSLRAAIQLAAADGEPSDINFKRDMTGTIELNSGLTINSNDLSIVGPGAAKLHISGNNLFRVLSIPVGTERFYMSGLTIKNGQTPNQGNGAGILIENALETRLENIRVINNSADNNGGGIYALNAGLKLINSEISNNTATNDGGGIGVVGGFGSDVSIENTTISHNQANPLTGGLYINSSFGQNALLRFVTVAFNSQGSTDSQISGSGDVIIESSVFEPGLSITNSNNITNNSIFKNLSGSGIFGNNNLSETETILNPALVEINNSGLSGHKFEPTSLAYNHVDDAEGDSSCGIQITSDQFDNPRPTEGLCDAGAYEYRFIDVIFISGFE